MTKKIWWIIGAVVAVLIIAIIAIAFRLAKKQAPLPAGLTEVVQTASRPIGLAINDKGEALYFDGVKKEFFKNKQAISGKLNLEIKNNTIQVKWSDDFSAALLRSGGQVYLYDFNAKKLNILYQGVKDAEFLGKDKLLTLVVLKDQKYLATSDFAGSNANKIMDIAFPAGNLVLSPDKKTAVIGDNKRYQIISLTNKKATSDPVFYQIHGLSFSPDNKNFAFNVANGDLIIVNLASNKKSTVQTSAANFVWAGNERIVFALSKGAQDEIMSYTLGQKPKTDTLAKSAGKTKVDNLFFKDGVVYFSAQNDIYSLKIK